MKQIKICSCGFLENSLNLHLKTIYFGTQLKDPSFRRHVLVQCLILFDYLKVMIIWSFKFKLL